MKYSRFFLFMLTLLLLCPTSSLVRAQGIITDAPATFILDTGAFSVSPRAQLNGVSAILKDEHLHETGWWFRLAGDSQETFFPVPTTQTYVGNIATLTWTNVGNRGLFSAELQWVVTNEEPSTSIISGTVHGVMTITNLSGVNSLPLNLFHMADFDVQATAQDDSAVFGPTGIRIMNPPGSVNTARYIGIGADQYLVRPFGATDVGTVLSNAGVDNFDNSGLPFAPGDITAGWQWKDRVIPPSGTLRVVVVLTVNGPVDLRLTKTGAGSTAATGAILYKLGVSNVGMRTATGVTLIETVPANTTFNPGASSAGWSCVPNNNAGSTCTLEVGSVGLGAPTTFDYAVTVIASPTSSTITNTAMVADDGANGRDPVPADNTATFILSGDPGISKTDGLTTSLQGGVVTYTIVVSNGGGSSVTGATVADTFPAACGTVSWTCVGTGGGTCTSGPVNGNINDTVALPAGSSVVYTAVCQLSSTATGILSNTATLTATPDGNLANNSATDTTTLLTPLDLSISKTDGVTTVAPGGTVTYAIVASNNGPLNITNVTVTDAFPAACTTVSWTCAGTGGGICAAGSGTGNINNTANLPAGGSVTYTATCTLSVFTGQLINTALLFLPAGVPDANAANNSATDTDTVACMYVLNPPNQLVVSSGEARQTTLTTQVECNWTAVSNVPWVTVTGGSSGNGSGIVQYTVAANPGPNPRRGTMTIGGKTFIVTQRTPVPDPCTILTTPLISIFGSGGGGGNVTITASTGSCQWEALSHASWITLTSAPRGSGSGTVTYNVAVNSSGGPRAGRISVNGKLTMITQN